MGGEGKEAHIEEPTIQGIENEHVLFSQTAWVGILTPTLNKCNVSRLLNS